MELLLKRYVACCIYSISEAHNAIELFPVCSRFQHDLEQTIQICGCR